MIIVLEFISNNWKEILAFSGPLGAGIGYMAGKQKRKVELSKAVAEVAKTEAEVDKAELENVALALKIYKDTLDDLRVQLKNAETLRLKVENLLQREISKKERLESENEYLVSLFKSCQTDGCPNTSETIRERIEEIRLLRLANEN